MIRYKNKYSLESGHVRKQVTREVHLQSQMYNGFGIEYYFT